MKFKQITIRFITLFLFLLFSFSVVLIETKILNKKKPLQPRMSGAMKALNFWTRSRAYPEKDIPKDKFYKGFQKEKFKLKKNSHSVQNNSVWRAMGPHNVPGRMISLAVNPQNTETLYAGSASGGLWRTFKASTGENWQRIHTGFPVHGVMAIAIDPADSNIIYIGTGEVYGYQRSTGGEVIRTTRGSYGIGILKTTDGGNSWFKSLDWTYNQEKGIQCIRINPLNPNSICAATTEGIYKSVNGGNSWELILAVLMGEDIIIHPTDTSKILVSCGNLGSEGTGIYKSIDAGNTWNKITTAPTFTGKTLLEKYESIPDLIFASFADSLEGIGLYQSPDFGDTWIQKHNRDIPRYQGWFSHWVAVHPLDSSQIVHAGVNIYRIAPDDPFIKPTANPHVDHHNYTHDPIDPNILYIACDGGVYRSADFGISYDNIGYGLQTAQFYNGFSSSNTDSNLAMGGLQDNNTVIYSGNKNWKLVIGGDGCWTAINQLDDNVLYGEYQNNNILKSVNRGQSFFNATNGMTGLAAFVAPYVISPSQPSILYSGRKLVFKSINEAENWQPTNKNNQLDGNYILSMAISSKNPDIVYAGTAPLNTRANIFRTTNGGNSWAKVTNSLPDRYPMDIAIDPNDDQIVYVVYSGFGTGHVFKSVNEGQSWQDITGVLPDVPTLAVVVDPINSNHVYVGNDLGVYFSQDGGNSWDDFNNGLPEAVMAMDLNVSMHNRNLRIATHGNGAWQRFLMFNPTVHLVYTLKPIQKSILTNSEIEFSANVINYGFQTQSEAHLVTLRVVDSGKNEIFSESKQIQDLAPQENLDFKFYSKFKTGTPGNYEIQLIGLGSSSMPRADTTKKSLSVITPPSISRSNVFYEFREYLEISSNEGYLTGDDAQRTISLPFPFIFDKKEYDQIQISTNGWCEFGRGTTGSLYGLSSAGQIGSNGADDNNLLASTYRPTKVLAPWWEDLSTSGGGRIIYSTTGNAPFRIFTIQWKNMKAYWDEKR